MSNYKNKGVRSQGLAKKRKRKKKKLISKKGELKREQNNGEGEMKKIPTIPIQAEMVIIPPNKI